MIKVVILVLLLSVGAHLFEEFDLIRIPIKVSRYFRSPLDEPIEPAIQLSNATVDYAQSGNRVIANLRFAQGAIALRFDGPFNLEDENEFKFLGEVYVGKKCVIFTGGGTFHPQDRYIQIHALTVPNPVPDTGKYEALLRKYLEPDLVEKTGRRVTEFVNAVRDYLLDHPLQLHDKFVTPVEELVL